MKYILILILSAFLLKPIGGTAQNVHKNYLDGEVYFKIKNSVPYLFDNDIREVNIENKLPFLLPLVQKYGITRVESSFYFANWESLKRTFRIHYQKAELVNQFIADLKKLEQADYAEEIPANRHATVPNDLGANTYSGQYNLHRINAPMAWDISKGSTAVKVAIVDNAIDINHPDLAGNVSSSRDVADNDNNPVPPSNLLDHGTHVAGIVGAVTNNGVGISSIGYNCKIIAVKATPDASTNDNIYYGYEGIVWAATNGAHFINCSWGGKQTAPCNTCQNSVNLAISANVGIVAAAGNDNDDTLFYPAAYNNVLSVAATDLTDTKASFSNYGSWIGVSAPGVSIYSTLPFNQYGYKSGTSMASPLVAGLCGLIKSLDINQAALNIFQCIKNGSDNINSVNPNYVGLLGAGRVNARRAMNCTSPCYGNLNLGTGNYTVPKTESSGSITTSNNIPIGSQVTLDAASLVLIQPGFVASNGSFFNAYIEGCGGSLRETAGVNKIPGNTEDNSRFDINPNPFTTSFNLIINAPKTTKAQVSIFNSLGVKMKALPVINASQGRNQITVEGSSFAKGVYLVEVRIGNEKVVKKIVKL